jgi:hypothetical protein
MPRTPRLISKGSFEVPPVTWIVAAALLLLALEAVFSARLAPATAGLDPLGRPSVAELDSPSEPDDREAPRFLAERNEVELVVPRDMTLDELVRLYQIDFPHVLAQISEKEGLDAVSRRLRLRQGARYRITLTPRAEDVP